MLQLEPLAAPSSLAGSSHLPPAPIIDPWTQEPTRLRAGTHADAVALEELEAIAFLYDRLSRRNFRRFSTSSTAALIVAENKGDLWGYVLLLFRHRSRIARVYSLAVNPTVRGNKIGSRLLHAAEDEARRRASCSLSLEVREDNAAARTLYRRCGYVLSAQLPAYYADACSALRLRKIVNRSGVHSGPLSS